MSVKEIVTPGEPGGDTPAPVSIERDADGSWQRIQHPSGVISRVLVDPSPTYLSRQQAEEAATENRRRAIADAKQAKVAALKEARSFEELKSALLEYLGINDH